MKKVIKYRFLAGEVDDKKVFVGKTTPYSEETLEIVKQEAYEGKYTIEEIPESAPSQLDIIEAQVTYTALMTDTLL